jgi:adenylate cyclase
MRLPVRLPEHHPLQRWLAAALIAALCGGVGVALSAPVRLLAAVRALDHVAYDALYRLRPHEPQHGRDVVIVAVDDHSIETLDRLRRVGWPWPRDYWGQMVTYLDSVGARAIVFDLLFDRSSVYNRPPSTGGSNGTSAAAAAAAPPTPGNDDDRAFAEAIDAAATPVILATVARPDGSTWGLAPPVAAPHLGAANVSSEEVVRAYAPSVHGHPSLALQTLRRISAAPPAWAQTDAPFLLRYYGPHAVNGKPATFPYPSAVELLHVTQDPTDAPRLKLDEAALKGKIVVIATITAGTYDLKASPLSTRYPGAELHATAIQNMLSNQRVTPAPPALRVTVLLLACLTAAAGTVLPARTPLKMLGGLAGACVVIAVTAALFLRPDVRWLPPAAALIAATLAAFAGLAWSYLTEGRQRRFVLSALAQSVSPEVADQIARDPRKLSLGGENRDMTVMFTDIADFTTLSEQIPPEQLADTLHLYLGEMSQIIIRRNGYLDKYIGDAIMSFWNAPAAQADHALRACHAALEFKRRELELQPRFKALCGHELHSRIGINSGPMIVGNMGSPLKFAYTVLGDSVNLASRIEGANKMYGTRVLLTESTAKSVRDAFVLRKIDLLRVKGKRQPMAVYELVSEGAHDPATADLIARYERALTLYQAQQFDASHDALTALTRDFPADGPTATLLARVQTYRTAPPPPDWDGVFVAKDK